MRAAALQRAQDPSNLGGLDKGSALSQLMLELNQMRTENAELRRRAAPGGV